MENFYFTYGVEGHPFYGGWTTVRAKDEKQACALFRAVHPDQTEGLLNCASVYDQETFERTKMFKTGNFGHGCHEFIRADVGVDLHAAN